MSETTATETTATEKALLSAKVFVFHGVGTVVEKQTEMAANGVRRTTLVLEDDPMPGDRAPNRVRVFFRRMGAVEAAGIEVGTTIEVEGRLGGNLKYDSKGNARAFPYVSGSEIRQVDPEADVLTGFRFTARGKVVEEPGVGETRGGVAHTRVLLGREYDSFQGPQTTEIEVNAFGANAMKLKDVKPGYDVYVEGGVASRTYEDKQTGEPRWTTDLFVREAIVLTEPDVEKAVDKHVTAKTKSVEKDGPEVA